MATPVQVSTQRDNNRNACHGLEEAALRCGRISASQGRSPTRLCVAPVLQWALLSLLLVGCSLFLLAPSGRSALSGRHTRGLQFSADPHTSSDGFGGALLPPSTSADPVLSRSDMQLNDHVGFLLFRHRALAAVDTASTPDLQGRVHHKTKSWRSFGNMIKGAATSATNSLMGWSAGQTKKSLLDTATDESKQAHTLAHTQAKMRTLEARTGTVGGAREAPPAPTRQDSNPAPLLVTYLVHFAAEVDLNAEVLAEFTAKTGLTLGAYFPHHSYLLVASEAQVAKIREQLSYEFVDWIHEYPNLAKIVSSSLADLVELTPRERESGDGNKIIDNLGLNLQLQPLENGGARTLEQLQALSALIADFLDHHELAGAFKITALPSFHNNLLHLYSQRALKVSEVSTMVEALSELVEIHVIERRLEAVLRNEIAQQLTQSGTSTAGKNGDGRTVWAQGIRGEGQIVGCADSGCDWDHCFFNGVGSPAPTGTVNTALKKVIAYTAFADTEDEVGGHGTHVTGSIVGNGASAPGDVAEHSGQAPGALLYFQDIGVTSTGTLAGLQQVGDLGSGLFSPAYDAGARVHSNSWGSADNTYTTEAQSIDQFIWQDGGKTDKHMLILVAAGNDGLKQGSVQSTVGSPATAKNILAVGASQTTTEGWIQSVDYTDWAMKSAEAASQLGVSPSSFDCCNYPSNDAVPKYCCKSRVVSDIQNSPQDHGAGNMADFSSRGPTADGRVKPEIVAPGQYIISSKSDGKKGSEQCGSVQSALTSMAGTSMATPITAGNAALLRQYLEEGWYGSGTKGASTKFTDPSAALMAAFMINGAQSLDGRIDERNDGTVMAPLSNGIFPLSVFQGFGRVTMDRSLWFAGETRYHQWAEDQATEVTTGKDVDYCLTPSTSGDVKATMVYHDAPGQVGAGVAATNNLDLYMGHGDDDAIAGNFRLRRDTLNNAESAIFSATAGKTLFVKVRGIQVPQPSQYYALVISGPFDPATVKVGADLCGSATKFAINGTRFAEATSEDHFPLGPVVGGVVGGVGGLALIGAIIKVCWDRYKRQGTVL